LRRLKAAKLPVIELRTTVLKHPFPFVGMDNRLVAFRVAEHFLARGFRSFACYLDKAEAFFVERWTNFESTLRSLGFECALFESPSPMKKSKMPRWDQHLRSLSSWLQSLPKPVGVFAINDQLGFWLLDAARRAGLSVPEEVAVVGAENDKMLCETAWPPLSSVQLRGQAAGYTAARLLDEWMRGQRIPAAHEQHLLPPGDVVVRPSSDIVAVEDVRIARALQYIREHATEEPSVERVAREASLSRSALERRMKALTGRSPGEEIDRIRFATVERLLIETDLTLDSIAERAGFQHPQYMAEAFKKRQGLTPGEFRRRRKI
jgi:LacI family transcriptional regulator